MTIEEQYKMMFPYRFTSRSSDYCKKSGCKDYEHCVTPCDFFAMWVRLTVLEDLIFGREEGEKK